MNSPASRGRSLFLSLVVFAFSWSGLVRARTVVDGAGRTLTLPDQVLRVYATSPVGLMMLYSAAPDKVVGWNYQMGEQEKKYILPSLHGLPVLGGWFGESGRGNRETLLAAKPDLVLSIGMFDATAIDFADRLQNQLGVPVFVDSGKLADTAEAYERLGQALGVPERTQPLADQARRILARTREIAARVPPTAKPRIYYAEGLRGLQTDTQGSMHTEPLDFLGIQNVATGAATSGYGRISVSLEQVIAWAPDCILICPEKGPAGEVWRPEWLADPAWKAVPAVAKGRLLIVPPAPFNWFDRPPSPARLMGLQWLCATLWPEEAAIDLVTETRSFYRLFYHYEMSEAEAREMLRLSTPTGPDLFP